MNLLLTNDDGIFAEGLWALFDRFSHSHAVHVIAPDRERTGVGHGITLNTPLRIEKMAVNGRGQGIAVNGTPADCIKIALVEVLNSKPDMVISGINPGANVGVNLNYSGTVAAAKEAALYGIPALAVSIHGRSGKHYQEAARFIETLAGYVLDRGMPKGTFLNINLPDLPLSEMAGIKISRQAISMFPEYFEKRTDPRNQTYFWQGCDSLDDVHSPDTDRAAIHSNYISITPVKCDMTDYHLMDELKTWFETRPLVSLSR